MESLLQRLCCSRRLAGPRAEGSDSAEAVEASGAQFVALGLGGDSAAHRAAHKPPEMGDSSCLGQVLLIHPWPGRSWSELPWSFLVVGSRREEFRAKLGGASRVRDVWR